MQCLDYEGHWQLEIPSQDLCAADVPRQQEMGEVHDSRARWLFSLPRQEDCLQTIPEIPQGRPFPQG